ncbi:GtrA family protein [Oryzobacter sp. R7]|uniref:GtrA family protein n=1 Tax=Oryzobacter faecalis TaxID=3388656 RepID=UPI00398CAE6F
MTQLELTAVVPPRPAIAGLRERWAALPLVVRYLVGGSGTQVVYLGALGALLQAPLHYMAALAVAQVVAMVFAFPLYRGVVFASDGPWRRQLLAFAGVWWTGTVMSVVGVPLLVETAGLDPLLAQVLVLGVVLTWSFLGHTRLTFRRRAANAAAAG